jgi:hypothetical protein
MTIISDVDRFFDKRFQNYVLVAPEMDLLTTSTSCASTARTGAGGYVHIVCGRLKTWQMDVKMNCSCSAVSFLDEDTVTTSGVGTAVTHNHPP